MARRKKKKRTNRLFVVLLILAVLLIVVYTWWPDRSSRFIHYPAFGIPVPENYPIHGIDVSRYQQSISWEAVSEMKVKEIKLGFAFIKATEGIGNTDPFFGRNWRRSKRAGIIRGAYHFFIASKDGRSQAENFIKQVDLEPGDLPPVVDVEQLSGTRTSVFKKELKEFLDMLEQHYGTKPLIYTNVDFYTRHLGSEFDRYPLWVAHYFQYNEPRISRSWTFWQHSEEGRVNGIHGKVDFNVFNGDSTDLKNLLIR